jgi:hypothetical protein
MSEQPTVAPAPEAANPNVAGFEFRQLGSETVSVDLATIPSDTRLDFLKNAVRDYIANRLNGLSNRFEKDEKVLAWNAYDKATAADPLQSIVAKPEGERPTPPDYKAAFDRAIADLVNGTIRKRGDEPAQRKVKDPLIATITDAVVRAVYGKERETNPKYSFFEARKAVGTDGLAYLNAIIEEQVAAGGDRAMLEASRDERFVNPAKNLLGMGTNKKLAGKPSLL